MARGFWITFYREIRRPEALAAYGKAAVPAIEAGGGRFPARGMPVRVYEAGLNERAVVIEFENLDKAIRTFESAAYQAAAKLLAGAVERDIRIIEET